MMTFRTLLAAGAAATTLFAAGAANAAIVFVGSWLLNDGPAAMGPLSGQQAAAQLFGGDAADYLISTAGPKVSSINGQAWYLLVDLPSAGVVNDAQDATDFAGLDITAYGFEASLVPEESEFVNYAFKDDGRVGGVPEPATWALMIGGFGLTGAALRRRRPALG
jgi:hypothetical protein